MVASHQEETFITRLRDLERKVASMGVNLAGSVLKSGAVSVRLPGVPGSSVLQLGKFAVGVRDAYGLQVTTPAGTPALWAYTFSDDGTSRTGIALTSLLPAGGSSGQVLRKNSATDFDATWSATSLVPAGGSSGQVLQKNSGTDFDAVWSGSGFRLGGQRGVASVTAGAVDNITQAVSYPTAFASGVTPSVMCNIVSASGSTSRCRARAISITNTGFTMFVESSASGVNLNWTVQSVQWIAVIDS